MAELLGLKQAGINKDDYGTTAPTIETLRKYVDYFNVSIDYIHSMQS